jgi:hypothetical protein
MSIDDVLIDFLNAQRARAFEILAGLDEDQLVKSVLPSGWTPIGMIEHLGHAEWHWFQEVAMGSVEPPPWNIERESTGSVFAFYRDQIEQSNAVLASTPLSEQPRGHHGQGDSDQVTDLRFIVVHMIEETARHLGHLDAARELIDGRIGLGQDPL